ncbi:MAG: hypothetical protein U0271_11335 [Polyangiaceae bacterium]
MSALPITEDQTRWIFRRAGTLALAGCEPVGPFVLPNARFFPDKFDRTPASVGRLFDRMKEHVGLSDVPTNLTIIDPEEGRVVSSCSSGGCGTASVKTLSGERVTEVGDGYVVQVATPEVAHSTALTTALSRALGQIFLREADILRAFSGRERQLAGDLAATMLGLGVLVANGSGIAVKGCGGVKIHSATSFSAPEAVLALAVAAGRQAERSPNAEEIALTSLDPVAASLYEAAAAIVRGNKSLVRMLDDGPATLEADNFVVRPPRSGSIATRLLNVLGVGKREPVDPVEALEQEVMKQLGDGPKSGGAAGRRTRTASEDARREELRALVDESFGSS